MNDPLAKYNFRDDHGHPLENCAEYQKMLATLEIAHATIDAMKKLVQVKGQSDKFRTDQMDKIKAALI